MIWDQPGTARYYEQFCNHHDRYRRANEHLVGQADIQSDQKIMDVGAGIGGTSEWLLPLLGSGGSILCIEPAEEMFRCGKRRLTDPRVQWMPALPKTTTAFDRILCGSSIWILGPLENTIIRLAGLLKPGGKLCFNIPALYLGEPDEPGGGDDPFLLSIPSQFNKSNTDTSCDDFTPLPDADGVEKILKSNGLETQRRALHLVLTQAAYKDWLKIPAVSGDKLSETDPDGYAKQLDEIFTQLDPCSWRWEKWWCFIGTRPKDVQ